ncbi:MAG TPA: LysR substrate-binding domain-containing protein [Steroidobacteraceae bacterium]|nr:LysR substrate-binding domain-containing protein [Steroidobacteraceae bacterium]
MPPRKTPPLRLLRAFCLVARALSFKQAADRLALTPSAVSHQVRELEEMLGVQLFERRSRAVVLTAVGRVLLEELEPALAAVNAAVERASHATQKRRELHVVMPPFFASELFAPRLQDFHDRHPNIDIHVDTTDPRPAQHAPSSDVSILLSDRRPEGDVEAVRLFPLRLVAACAPDLARALNGRGLEAIEQHALIMHRFRPWAWDRWLESMGADKTRARNLVEFDSMFLVARAAEQGAGIALVPTVLCEPWFERGSLVPLPSLEFDTGDSYYLVARAEDGERPEVHAFTEWTLEQFQRGK